MKQDTIKFIRKNADTRLFRFVSIDEVKAIIEVIKQELADCKLRCDELIARNAQLEERDYLNKGEVE